MWFNNILHQLKAQAHILSIVCLWFCSQGQQVSVRIGVHHDCALVCLPICRTSSWTLQACWPLSVEMKILSSEFWSMAFSWPIFACSSRVVTTQVCLAWCVYLLVRWEIHLEAEYISPSLPTTFNFLKQSQPTGQMQNLSFRIVTELAFETPLFIALLTCQGCCCEYAECQDGENICAEWSTLNARFILYICFLWLQLWISNVRYLAFDFIYLPINSNRPSAYLCIVVEHSIIWLHSHASDCQGLFSISSRPQLLVLKYVFDAECPGKSCDGLGLKQSWLVCGTKDPHDSMISLDMICCKFMWVSVHPHSQLLPDCTPRQMIGCTALIEEMEHFSVAGESAGYRARTATISPCERTRMRKKNPIFGHITPKMTIISKPPTLGRRVVSAAILLVAPGCGQLDTKRLWCHSMIDSKSEHLVRKKFIMPLLQALHTVSTNNTMPGHTQVYPNNLGHSNVHHGLGHCTTHMYKMMTPRLSKPAHMLFLVGGLSLSTCCIPSWLSPPLI